MSLSSIEIARKKWPTRGGQNLSLRFSRLEKSLRGKEGYDKNIAEFKEDSEDNLVAQTSTFRAPKKPTFMGFVIPEKPNPPADDECCMSGCAICVYDLYEEALNDYNDALSSLRTSLEALHIHEDDWPASIRPTRGQGRDRKNVFLSAFEELELRLKQKQENNAARVVGTSNLLSSAPTSHTNLLDIMALPLQTPPAPADPYDASGVVSARPSQDQQFRQEQATRSRRRRRRKAVIPDAGSLYEGLRWVLFSRR